MSVDKFFYMEKALELAKYAKTQNEVPVGAIIVQKGVIIGSGYNQMIKMQDPTAHAEILAIKEASSKLKNYRLQDCDLYTTIEPCLMCMGAILHSRIKKIYFGVYDEKFGAIFSRTKVLEHGYNHKIELESGVLKKECKEIIQSFFQEKRKKL